MRSLAHDAGTAYRLTDIHSSMCQLLGMSGNKPTSLRFSLDGFLRRGGETDHHADGWGIAFHEGRSCKLFLDDQPAAGSSLVERIKRMPLRARNVIAHVRKATHGEVSLSNCHPFVRLLWGRQWVFAHNGDLPGFRTPADAHFKPIGSTDSEAAFCALLDGLRTCFGNSEPSTPTLYLALRRISAELASHGTFNYLLTNGELLFAHCSTSLYYSVRQAPFGTVKLIDCGVQVDLAQLNQADDRYSVVATQPLTEGEAWQALQPGELKVFLHGEELSQAFAPRP